MFTSSKKITSTIKNQVNWNDDKENKGYNNANKNLFGAGNGGSVTKNNETHSNSLKPSHALSSQQGKVQSELSDEDKRILNIDASTVADPQEKSDILKKQQDILTKIGAQILEKFLEDTVTYESLQKEVPNFNLLFLRSELVEYQKELQKPTNFFHQARRENKKTIVQVIISCIDGKFDHFHHLKKAKGYSKELFIKELLNWSDGDIKDALKGKELKIFIRRLIEILKLDPSASK